jgi:GxxExxY protein
MTYHGDTDTLSDLLHEELTESVIGAVHEAQLLTYLKMTGKRVGLILNFNSSVLTRGGIFRKVL